MYTDRLPELRPPPTPSPAPVVRQYNWPEQANPSAAFSIVTTSGPVYLATMVWVEGANVQFNSVDGGFRQIPLASVSRSLTQTAKCAEEPESSAAVNASPGGNSTDVGGARTGAISGAMGGTREHGRQR